MTSVASSSIKEGRTFRVGQCAVGEFELRLEKALASLASRNSDLTFRMPKPCSVAILIGNDKQRQEGYAKIGKSGLSR